MEKSVGWQKGLVTLKKPVATGTAEGGELCCGLVSRLLGSFYVSADAVMREGLLVYKRQRRSWLFCQFVTVPRPRDTCVFRRCLPLRRCPCASFGLAGLIRPLNCRLFLA